MSGRLCFEGLGQFRPDRLPVVGEKDLAGGDAPRLGDRRQPHQLVIGDPPRLLPAGNGRGFDAGKLGGSKGSAESFDEGAMVHARILGLANLHVNSQS